MKKYSIFFITILTFVLSGCTIDYDAYFKKYGNIYNKDESLSSVRIPDGTLEYPNNNQELIEKYGEVYLDEIENYSVYASYYSTNYDTLYISYDSNSDHKQTIDSKQLALIEEHLLNYFVSDTAKNDYTKYVKVIRIYPDYKSSVCRTNNIEEIYSKIEGCANYNSLSASINLNGLTNIDRFFNPYSYNEGEYVYTYEPKRDTFAHEFGHVSTYYNMILKGDDSYKDYLKLRLGNAYNSIYFAGLPNAYDTENGYYTQPVEILADDYVELYYDTSNKLENDYYDYTLEYNDIRNSLTGVENVSQYLKKDSELYDVMKEYYDVFINKQYINYNTPKIIRANGSIYSTMHDIENEKSGINLNNKLIVALGELQIDGEYYYRVILSNVVMDESINIRQEYSKNIGYILKDNAIEEAGEVLYFTKYKGNTLDANLGLDLGNGINLYPYYDFAYLIKNGNMIKIYNYLDSTFTTLEAKVADFS